MKLIQILKNREEENSSGDKRYLNPQNLCRKFDFGFRFCEIEVFDFVFSCSKNVHIVLFAFKSAYDNSCSDSNDRLITYLIESALTEHY